MFKEWVGFGVGDCMAQRLIIVTSLCSLGHWNIVILLITENKWIFISELEL